MPNIAPIMTTVLVTALATYGLFYFQFKSNIGSFNLFEKPNTTDPEHFRSLTVLPPDPIYDSKSLLIGKNGAQRTNLGVGAYRTDDGVPYIFNAVKKAEAIISQDYSTYNKEYLGVDGYQPFIKSAQKVAFGDHLAISENRIATLQTIGGTGALVHTFKFLHDQKPNLPIYFSDCHYKNYLPLAERAGLEYKFYPYYNSETKRLNFGKMIEFFQTIPSGSMVLVQAAAHNPTGIDPTYDQWTQVIAISKKKNFIMIIDNAYQGFVTGSLEKDRIVQVRFLDAGINFILCSSFSKNMGLYGERIGAVHFVSGTKEVADAVRSHIKKLAIGLYSVPPSHGAYIVDTIVRNPNLWDEYKTEMKNVADRVIAIRQRLVDLQIEKKTPGDWSHIIEQKGMFSFTGLNEKQSDVMINKWDIYMLRTGRISMVGVNSQNVKKLAEAIDDAVRNY